jgi:hypothetical protein
MQRSNHIVGVMLSMFASSEIDYGVRVSVDKYNNDLIKTLHRKLKTEQSELY